MRAGGYLSTIAAVLLVAAWSGAEAPAAEIEPGTQTAPIGIDRLTDEFSEELLVLQPIV